MTHKSASAEWDALQRALLSHRPACAGDIRFTFDDPPNDELAPICRACPLTVVCGAYGRAARPAAGYWAGTTYTRPQRKEAA